MTPNRATPNRATPNRARESRAPARRAPCEQDAAAGSAMALLRQAAAGLEQAAHAPAPTVRFAHARLAALRAAAAVLAMRATSRRGPRGPGTSSVWTLLAEVAPELGEWSAFFAAASLTRSITVRQADDLLRQSEQFIGLAHRAALARRHGVGVPHG